MFGRFSGSPIKSTLNYEITIYSDSQLIINAVNKKWLKSWIKNGWKKADKTRVLNIDLWERLIELISNYDVKFVWVKGIVAFQKMKDVINFANLPRNRRI